MHGTVDALAPGFAEMPAARAHYPRSTAASLDPDTIRRLHDQGASLSEQQAVALARTLIDAALTN